MSDRTYGNEEKAKLFGEAFRNTRDWVVILDSVQQPIAVNKSFCEAFQIENEKGFDYNISCHDFWVYWISHHHVLFTQLRIC